MPNALSGETSPYLLQHRDNPVDWLPWGDEALRRAREEDRPLLVSIGYSACHWCHVMERESFEDEAVASAHERALRVREGRPRGAPRRRRDLHGGRPGDDGPRRLAAERLPHARAEAVLRRHVLPARAAATGMPAGAQVLERRRRGLGQRAGTRSASRATSCPPSRRRRAARSRRREPHRSAVCSTTPSLTLRETFDAVQGGWGGAPKFPGASVIEFLLRRGEPAMALQTLRSMASGGIYDQIGGGFARYSVDATLDGPALREDALRQRAARARLPARVAGQRRCRAAAHRRGDAGLGVARDDARRRRLLHRPGRRLRGRGGQVLRLVADELAGVLGDDAEAAIAWFGATEQGNFPEPAPTSWSRRGPEPAAEQRERIRAALLAARSERACAPGWTTSA